MSDFPTANFSGNDDGLFTVAEIRALMEAEFDRALRYQYPLAFMALVVDRLEHLQDLYGFESKAVILRSVTDLLKSVSRSSDFLGCLVEDRVLILLPYTTTEGAEAIARRLISGARTLQFDGDGNMLHITVSIGVSHNQGATPHTYADLVQTAEGALGQARSEGGDRCIVKEAAPPAARLRRRTDSTPAAPAAPSPTDEVALFDRIREYLVLQGDIPPGGAATRSEGLEKEIVSSVIKALRIEREAERQAEQARETEAPPAPAQPQPQVQAQPQGDPAEDRRLELLERRLTKLSDSLSSTERTLSKIAQAGAPDEGIASIYREVQGISEDEPDSERKREMMSQIFQANLDLHERTER